MGLFDFFKSEPQYTEREVMMKAMLGVAAYQKKDFVRAASLFAEYFDMKGYGKFPTLDADDFRMSMNLMLSQFYSKDYKGTINTCNRILDIKPNSGDVFAFLALSNYKLRNYDDADAYWEKAKRYGSQMTISFDSVSDVRMDGFN